MAKETRTVPSRTWSQTDWGDYPSTGQASKRGRKAEPASGTPGAFLAGLLRCWEPMNRQKEMPVFRNQIHRHL